MQRQGHTVREYTRLELNRSSDSSVALALKYGKLPASPKMDWFGV
jgi:hypothetical protein